MSWRILLFLKVGFTLTNSCTSTSRLYTSRHRPADRAVRSE